MAVRSLVFFHRIVRTGLLLRSYGGPTCSILRIFSNIQLSFCRPQVLCCWKQFNTSATYSTAEESELSSKKGLELPGTVVQSTYNDLIDSAKQKPALNNREQFALVLKEFMAREKYRKGHVSFIKLALHRMDEFGLEKDLLTYNRILDIFPKGRFVARRMLDAIWPRSLPQMELALELLSKMEEQGIRPDYNTYMLLIETFGKVSLPVQKCRRIAYWFDKFENADPYKVNGELPSDPLELSRLALARITGERGQLTEHKITPQDNGGSYYVISGSTPSQLQLLQSLGSGDGYRDDPCLLHVEGPNLIWMLRKPQGYYTLRLGGKGRGDRETERAEEEEGAILGVCMCHPTSQDSLKLWLRSLQETYPTLVNATVIYNIREHSTKETQSKQVLSGGVATISESTSTSA